MVSNEKEKTFRKNFAFFAKFFEENVDVILSYPPFLEWHV